MAQWRDVAQFENYYEVSDEGDVRNKRTRRELKSYKDKVTGYRSVALSRDGKRYDRLVHRLVAFAFVQNPEGLPQVNHIDGDKDNNHFSNLEWVSDRGNKKHTDDSGLSRLNKWVKIQRVDTQEIFNSMSSAASSIGGTQAGLHFALKGDRPYKGVLFKIVPRIGQDSIESRGDDRHDDVRN